jgi:exonuclease III
VQGNGRRPGWARAREGLGKEVRGRVRQVVAAHEHVLADDRKRAQREAVGCGWGLRTDHILLAPELAAVCKACGIDTEPRKRERPSDHAPVIAEL